jgi:hypothetical protein
MLSDECMRSASATSSSAQRCGSLCSRNLWQPPHGKSDAAQHTRVAMSVIRVRNLPSGITKPRPNTTHSTAQTTRPQVLLQAQATSFLPSFPSKFVNEPNNPKPSMKPLMVLTLHPGVTQRPRSPSTQPPYRYVPTHLCLANSTARCDGNTSHSPSQPSSMNSSPSCSWWVVTSGSAVKGQGPSAQQQQQQQQTSTHVS